MVYLSFSLNNFQSYNHDKEKMEKHTALHRGYIFNANYDHTGLVGVVLYIFSSCSNAVGRNCNVQYLHGMLRPLVPWHVVCVARNRTVTTHSR